MGKSIYKVWSTFVNITQYHGGIRHSEFQEATLKLCQYKNEKIIYNIQNSKQTKSILYRPSKLNGTPDFRYNPRNMKIFAPAIIEIWVDEYYFCFKTKKGSISKERLLEFECFLKSLT